MKGEKIALIDPHWKRGSGAVVTRQGGQPGVKSWTLGAVGGEEGGGRTLPPGKQKGGIKNGSATALGHWERPRAFDPWGRNKRPFPEAQRG